MLGLGVQASETDFAVLEVPDGATVEVFGPASRYNQHLVHPVAGFRVADLDDAVAELRAAGVEIVLPVQGGEVPDVLLDRQVVVGARRLGQVADFPAERRGARGPAEHRGGPGLDPLDADEASQQRRLPAAARPQQAGHRPRRDAEVEPVEDPAAAALDGDRSGDDLLAGHVEHRVG